MGIPFETIQAAFPANGNTCKAGLFRRVRLRPVTIAHAMALAACGCDLTDGEMGKADALVAAWILSQPSQRLARDMIRGGPERWGAE